MHAIWEICELSWVIQRSTVHLWGNSQKKYTPRIRLLRINVSFSGPRMKRFLFWLTGTVCVPVYECACICMRVCAHVHDWACDYVSCMFSCTQVCVDVCACMFLYVTGVEDGAAVGMWLHREWQPEGLVRWSLSSASLMRLTEEATLNQKSGSTGANSNSPTWSHWPWKKTSTSLGLVFQSASWRCIARQRQTGGWSPGLILCFP